MDKAGACTVLAAAATVARLAPGTPLLAVAPAVENMPGPHSTRPGDVVTRPQRQDRRRHQHGRRGPPHPRRRHDLRGAPGGDPHRRRRHAHRRGRPRLRPPGERRVRRPPGLVRRGRGGGGPGGRAALAAAPRRGVLAGDGELVRGHVERRLVGRRRPDPQRALPAPVRDGALGPPRHRRHGHVPQGHAVGGPRCHGCVARRRSWSWRWPGRVSGVEQPVLAAGLAIAGAAWGLAADRIGARWPAHEDEIDEAGRSSGRAAGSGRPTGGRSSSSSSAARRSVPWRSGSRTPSRSRSSGPSSPP